MQDTKNPRTIRIILWVLFVLVTIWALNSGLQGLMFPLFIGTYLLRERLKGALDTLSLPLAFIGTGLVTGLIIEVFAIADNWSLPPAAKVLLHPDPAIDLLIAFFWYGGFTLTWYLLLRKVQFPKKTVYLFSALYGVLTEFGVLIFITANPLIGIPLAAIVTAAYSIFPFIAYMLTEHRFPARILPMFRHYVYIVFAFLIFWAVIGNLVYNPLIALFPQF